MSDQDPTKTAKARNNRKFRYRFGKGNKIAKSSYKSKVAELKDNVFDVGTSSDTAKFSKLLYNIENYIQKT